MSQVERWAVEFIGMLSSPMGPVVLIGLVALMIWTVRSTPNTR